MKVYHDGKKRFTWLAVASVTAFIFLGWLGIGVALSYREFAAAAVMPVYSDILIQDEVVAEIVRTPEVYMEEVVTPAVEVEEEEVVQEEEIEEVIFSETSFDATEEDKRLIARLVAAEAGSESEEGQRLVIDVVLNRVEHPRFPGSISEVVYQPRHFSPVWNGGLERFDVRDDILVLVEEELAERINTEVIFFDNKPCRYGVALFQVGGHYFAKYE
jgi:N-acetylmuramoyl-L-alanine amidase